MSELDASKRNAISSRQFAFPKQRKEPLENAAHVRNAIARFNQVEGVTDAERDTALEAHHRSGEEIRRRGEREIVARDRRQDEREEKREAALKSAPRRLRRGSEGGARVIP